MIVILLSLTFGRWCSLVLVGLIFHWQNLCNALLLFIFSNLFPITCLTCTVIYARAHIQVQWYIRTHPATWAILWFMTGVCTLHDLTLPYKEVLFVYELMLTFFFFCIKSTNKNFRLVSTRRCEANISTCTRRKSKKFLYIVWLWF